MRDANRVGLRTNWNSRFTDSLVNWAKPNNSQKQRNYLLNSVEEEIKSYREVLAATAKTWLDMAGDQPSTKWRKQYERNFRDSMLDSELFLPVFRTLINQELGRIFHNFCMASNKCESPIEKIMLYALIVAGNELSQRCVANGYAFGGSESAYSTLSIEPQATIGKYRVVFLVIQIERSLDDFNKIIAQPAMVVECDGHRFHEKTKEQARRDRKKDRAIQSLGLRIYRYTGSDIWADVFACAHEVVNTLVAEALMAEDPDGTTYKLMKSPSAVEEQR